MFKTAAQNCTKKTKKLFNDLKCLIYFEQNKDDDNDVAKKNLAKRIIMDKKEWPIKCDK
jgi:hypothetical protein